MSGAAVRVRGLRHDYGEPGFRLALDALDLAPGEALACVGPSGSGKSTLLELLAGIQVPRAGSVTVDGLEVSAARDAARRRFRLRHVGLVFQSFELLEHLTVEENALLPYLVSRELGGGGVPAEARAELAEAARATGIDGLLRRRPRELSQGERQRVAICRALVTRPGLLLADEPTGNLDPRTSARVLDLLLGAVRERGTTLVLVTHDHGLLGRFERVLDLAELHAPAEGSAAP